MPKKHHRNLYAKPSSSPHSSLKSNSSGNTQNGRVSSSAKTPSTSQSVNELISHLRSTQVTPGKGQEPSSPSSQTPQPQRTVHPSLRNLLDIPETPQPRPRPGQRSRIRRIPGPPPPQSWLAHSRYAPQAVREQADATVPEYPVIRSWVEDDFGLPGSTLPEERTLVDIVCRNMARNWLWHQEYDRMWLASLPAQLKETLLSYIAATVLDARYSSGGKWNPLNVLWPQESELDLLPPGVDYGVLDDSSEVSRIDLEGALGSWITMKRLRKELLLVPKPRENMGTCISTSTRKHSSTFSPTSVPETWDDLDQETDTMPPSPPKPLDLSPTLRFSNLAHLSLALSPFLGSPSSTASWSALLELSPHLSTLRSLSLAHWPLPTLTPNARASNAYVRNPVSRSIPTVRYGGSDMYTEFDNAWDEAANILRRLSRSLYCLQWLDLRGCGMWWAALTWSNALEDADDSDSATDKDRPSRHCDIGPEWTGAWRGVESIGLEVGWAPQDPDKLLKECRNGDLGREQELLAKQDRHSLLDDCESDIEQEKYRRQKERQRYIELVERAETTARGIQALRRQKAGKWINFRLSSREPKIMPD